MVCKILVVEDEILVAMELEAIAEECGHEVVGIAADSKTALDYARHAEIALVDVNLRDGETGPQLGRRLAEEFGVTVVFMTANPGSLGHDVPGTLGVVSKPVTEKMTAEVIDFAVRRRRQAEVQDSPKDLVLFPLMREAQG